MKKLICDITNVDPRFRRARGIHAVSVAGVFCLIICLIGGCSRKPVQQGPQARPVQTAIVVQKDVPIYVDSFGNMASPSNVNVKSQVEGKLKTVHFKEGTEVRKGSLLFTVDPREYKAQFDKAEAAFAAALIQLKLKRDTLTRNKRLFKNKLISQQEYDQYQADVGSAEAQVKLDNASVILAKINLEYCCIRSPINGLTGKRLVDPGNLVSAGGDTLVNVKVIDPLYLDFTVPELRLPTIREAMAEKQLKVEVTAENDDKGPYPGELGFIDNTVDNSTGTIALRAIVPNEKRALWPGQFVDVRLYLGVLTNACLVPAGSVQLGQKGPYLFVVTSDNKADLRYVTVGQRQGDLLVIVKGVKPGEKVVTVGQMGLWPDCLVEDITQKQDKSKTQGKEPAKADKQQK